MPECTCTTCAVCRGRGAMRVDQRGRLVADYDPMGEPEICDECGGSGIVAECDACRDQRELEEDQTP